MADDKKKQDDKPKKHAHGEGPVTDAKTHAEAKKPGGGGKKKGGKQEKGPKTIQAAEGKAASRGEHPARLGIAYKDQIIPALMKEFGYKNPMQVPRVEKVVVNMGLGEAITNNKLIEQAEEQMMAITGQKAVVTRSRKSIANFKVRAYSRCELCGRSRACLNKCQMCRICFRNRALRGEITGVIKSSW